jgi:hypothetical protein
MRVVCCSRVTGGCGAARQYNGRKGWRAKQSRTASKAGLQAKQDCKQETETPLSSRPLLKGGGVFLFGLLKPRLPEPQKPVSRRTFKFLTSGLEFPSMPVTMGTN